MAAHSNNPEPTFNDDFGPLFVVTSALCIAFTIFFVMLQFRTRWKGIQLEDWTVLVLLVRTLGMPIPQTKEQIDSQTPLHFITLLTRLLLSPLKQTIAILNFIVSTVSSRYRQGHHAFHVPPPNLSHPLKMLWIVLCILRPTELYAKFSISLTLCRVAKSKKWYYFPYMLMIPYATLTCINVAAILFLCTPFQVHWDIAIPESCGSFQMSTAIGYVQAGTPCSQLTPLLNLRH